MPIPSEWDLSGKTAIITCDERGWTPVLANALASVGASVALAGSSKSDMGEASKLVKSTGGNVLVMETDLTNATEVDQMFGLVVKHFGQIDILVNNARTEFVKPFTEVAETEWDEVMDFNLKSYFLCCRAAGRWMLNHGGGHIVNIGSGMAVRGVCESAVVCASQGAIRQLTLALALEWAPHGIRINAIGGGWITPDGNESDPSSGLLEKYIPLRRRGHPSDLVELLIYLSSDACDFLTGQMISIDGGAMAHA